MQAYILYVINANYMLLVYTALNNAFVVFMRCYITVVLFVVDSIHFV